MTSYQNFFLVCQNDLVRFGDKCYEAAGNAVADLVSNINHCKNKGGDLVIPESSAEHQFIAQTFTSSNNMYHLGVVMYKVYLYTIFGGAKDT